MNKTIIKDSTKKKSIRTKILLFLCLLTLLLSACTPQANLPDDSKPKPNPDDPGLIDDNPNDPGEVDPNPPGKLVFTADVIKNLGTTKISYKPFDTFKHYSPLKLTPIDFSKIQWKIDFYKKGYTTLDSIFKDFPDLKATKQSADGRDVYTFSDGTRLEVVQNQVVLVSEFFGFSAFDKQHNIHTSVTETPPYEIIVIEDQIVLLNDQKKVVKYYYTGDEDFSDWKFGDFIGNNTSQLALFNRYSGNVSIFTVNEQGLTPYNFKTQIDELDALSHAVFDGVKFDVIFNEQKVSSIQNTSKTYSSILPTKILRNEYPKEESYYSANPLQKDIYTTIDPMTSKLILKVRWSLTDGLTRQIELAEAVYEFVDVNDLTKLKLKDVNLHYSDASKNDVAVQVEDLIVYDGNQVFFDTRSTPQDIVKTINSNATLPVVLEETLVIESASKKGLSLTFESFNSITESHIYKITDPRFSFNNKFKLGLTQAEVLALLGTPDLEDNDGIQFVDWTNDHRWSYFVASPVSGDIINSYSSFYKLVFIFKDGKVSEIQLIYYNTSV